MTLSWETVLGVVLALPWTFLIVYLTQRTRRIQRKERRPVMTEYQSDTLPTSGLTVEDIVQKALDIRSYEEALAFVDFAAVPLGPAITDRDRLDALMGISMAITIMDKREEFKPAFPFLERVGKEIQLRVLREAIAKGTLEILKLESELASELVS